MLQETNKHVETCQKGKKADGKCKMVSGFFVLSIAGLSPLIDDACKENL